jgi:hypothetical protein
MLGGGIAPLQRKETMMGGECSGSVYKRCGCRAGRAGLRRGASSPRVAEEGHGSWFFSLDLPRRLGGTRRRARRGGHPTEEAAQEALARLQVPGGHVLTVADWLDAWLHTRVRIRPTTRRCYAEHIRYYLAPRLGNVQLAEPNIGHLEQATPGAASFLRSSNASISRCTLTWCSSAVNRALLSRTATCRTRSSSLDTPCPALRPGHVSLAAFPLAGPLSSPVSAAAALFGGFAGTTRPSDCP